jgi:AcrR family transcriptional regulator
VAWREEFRERRRDTILKVAAAVFAEKSYQRATVREIAARVGVAPGTIYLYFKSKRDLLLAIADRLLTETLNRQLTELSDGSEEALLGQLLRQRFQLAHENQAFVRALVTAVWTDAEIRERFFAGILGPMFATLEEYVGTRMETGALRPCRTEVVVPAMVGAFFMFGVVRAIIPQGVLPDIRDEEVGVVVEELVQLYLYGLKLGAVGEARVTNDGAHPDHWP